MSVAQNLRALEVAPAARYGLPLEDGGIEFIDQDGGGPGVRLRQGRRSKMSKK